MPGTNGTQNRRSPPPPRPRGRESLPAQIAYAIRDLASSRSEVCRRCLGIPLVALGTILYLIGIVTLPFSFDLDASLGLLVGGAFLLIVGFAFVADAPQVEAAAKIVRPTGFLVGGILVFRLLSAAFAGSGELVVGWRDSDDRATASVSIPSAASPGPSPSPPPTPSPLTPTTTWPPKP